MIEEQMSVFDGTNKFKLEKPIRLISLFSGYDSQALALRYLGVQIEHYRTCEWAVPSIQALKDLHFGDDITDYSASLADSEIVDFLDGRVSTDYSTPMARAQIMRKGEKWRRKVFNNMKASHNFGNIISATAEELGVENTAKFFYICTYSFPCQDLSNAGKGGGMAKGSGTKSALLWEVERLLWKSKELPQVLLMENVPQVMGRKNKAAFAEWIESLEKLGYKSKAALLNAKDFGINQSRKRCFLLSILGDYRFEFPAGLAVKHKLEDFLNKRVDESYFCRLETIKALNLHEFLNKESCDDALAYDEQNGYLRRDGTVGTITTDGSSPKHNNRVIMVYNGFNHRVRADSTVIGINTTNVGRDVKGNAQVLGFSPFCMRKLTERECGKLMGVKPVDIAKIATGLSKAAQYHCYGDSIVTTVLMAIFGELLGVDWQTKVKETVEEIIE